MFLAHLKAEDTNMKYIKLILAAIFLLCLADMPYGFYMLVRFISMIVFTLYAIKYHQYRKQNLSIVFIALALLFQPFAMITLGRILWNIVDVIVALFLFILWIKENMNHKI